ncbi:MAG: type III polyketide synthase [Hyphomicrobiales bacterium]
MPPHVVDQEAARSLLAELFAPAGVGVGAGRPSGAGALAGAAIPAVAGPLARDGEEADWDRLLTVFDNAGIETRRVCMPLAWYAEEHTFGERNDLYLEHGLDLSAAAIVAALDRAAIAPEDVDHVVFVSSTGVSTPSLDASLANRLGFRRDVRRTPIWGLGCAGGAAGLARAREFALAAPGSRVLVVALELCSLAFQRRERSKRNLVAASIFADGAAAAIVSTSGADGHAGRNGSGAAARLVVEGSGSTLWPNTLDVMGWEVDGDGLHVVFSRDIPTIVRRWARESVERFLASRGLTLAQVDHVVSHPGGMKVLRAYQEALSVPEHAFRHARDVLRERGNMSSPTCLFVLERFLESGTIAPGETALLTALGPGFSAEYVLLRSVEG